MDTKQQIKNLESIYKHVTESDYQAGITWYNRAQEIVKYLADKYNRPDYIISGIIAALSPGTDWHQNLIDAINVLKQGRYANVTTYGQNKVKALRILEMTSESDVYQALLHKSTINKTSQFFLNIQHPEQSGPVTIDRHAIRACYDEILESSVILTAKRYREAAKAYQALAKRHSILPHQLQAVIWIAFRRLFDIPDKNKAIRLDQEIQIRLDQQASSNNVPF